MRFLCKKCGAQSPGDLSGIEVRNGALVFTCTSCGTSATLVAGKTGPSAGASPAEAAPVEKGVVEPDEDELVDLGEATLSRMLGKKVRIVAATEAPVGTPAEPAPEPAPERAEVAPAAEPEPVPRAEEPPQARPEEPVEPPATVVAAEERGGSSRKRVAGLLAAGVVLAAVVGFALLEARQPSSKDSSLVAASASGGGAAREPGPAEPLASSAAPGGTEAAPVAASAEPRKTDAPPARDDETVIEVKELAPAKPAGAPAPSPAVAAADALPAEVLDAAFWRVRPGVRMCATQEQRRDPDVVLGEEAVSVTFGASGEVTGVAFEHKELEGTPLGACLATEMRKVHLEPGPGKATTVRRVLALSRSSG